MALVLVCAAIPRFGLAANGDIYWNLYSEGEIHLTTVDDHPLSAHIGGLDLFAKADPTDSISVVSELMVMVMPSGMPMTHVARFYGEYELTADLSFAVGRTHIPLGYYATAYQHGGLMFQTTSNRPYVLNMNMGGEVLPMHNIGVHGTGTTSIAGIDVALDIAVGNGGSGAKEDTDHEKAASARLTLSPQAFYGLQFGISGYYEGKVSADRNPDGPRTAEVIGVGHIACDMYPYEFIAEYIESRHQQRKGDDFTLRAWYVQAAYRFLQGYQPYFRYEVMDRDYSFTGAANDPILEKVGAPPRLERLTAGVGIPIHSTQKLKLEYQSDLENKEHSLVVQLGIAFGQ